MDMIGRIRRLHARKNKSEREISRWATRRRPWVDRVASAWLIQRFIDRDARFQWLSQPSDCPKGALGFDFDGAAFTHVGERVTFETLMASCRIPDDCIDSKRYPLFMARAVLKELIESLQSTQGVKPC